MPGYQYPGPAAPVGPSGAPPPEALAGFWIRFGAALIDGVLMLFISALFGGLGFDTAGGTDLDPVTQLGTSLGYLLGGAFLPSLVYFTVLHGSASGQTLGDRACGIRVADRASGGRVPYPRALIRVLVSYVSAMPFALGYFWMLWQPQKQTWHDLAASTLVVKTSYYPAHR